MDICNRVANGATTFLYTDLLANEAAKLKKQNGVLKLVELATREKTKAAPGLGKKTQTKAAPGPGPARKGKSKASNRTLPAESSDSASKDTETSTDEFWRDIMTGIEKKTWAEARAAQTSETPTQTSVSAKGFQFSVTRGANVRSPMLHSFYIVMII